MLPSYDDNSSAASREAVALLLSDVGIACEMNYGINGSGTGSAISLQGLIDYFDYHPSCQVKYRSDYGLAEWTDTVYYSLAAGYPVYYAGTNPSGGHAFVCDGYYNGYFHINWGWNGMSNGFFLLTALDPAEQGTGGSAAGYNEGQEAITFLRPNDGSQEASESSINFRCMGDFDVTPKEGTRSTSFSFSGSFFNMGTAAINITPGLMVVDSEGNVKYVEASNYTTQVPVNAGWYVIEMTLTDFPTTNGTYTVYPAVRNNDTDKWSKIPVPITSDKRFLIATVSGNNITFENPTVEAYNLAATVNDYSTLYAGKSCIINGTVTNSGREYYNDVYVAFVTPGTTTAQTVSDAVLINLVTDSNLDCTFSATAPTTAGDYELVVLDYNMNIISPRVAVTVNSAPSGSLSLAVADEIVVTSPSVSTGEIAATDLQISTKIYCSSGYYGGNLYVFVTDAENSDNYTYSSTPFYIGAGETRDVSFHSSIYNATPGKTYIINFAYISNGSAYTITSTIGNLLYYYTTITIDLVTDVNDVKVAGMPQDIEVYNLSGVCLLRQHAASPDLSSLPRGIYIVKVGSNIYRTLHRK